MIQPGFLDERARIELTQLARSGTVAHRLARRANALILLDRGMSCMAVAEVLLLDDDTIRGWHRRYEQAGIQSLAEFGYRGSAPRLSDAQQISSARLDHRDAAAHDARGGCMDRSRIWHRL